MTSGGGGGGGDLRMVYMYTCMCTITIHCCQSLLQAMMDSNAAFIAHVIKFCVGNSGWGDKSQGTPLCITTCIYMYMYMYIHCANLCACNAVSIICVESREWTKLGGMAFFCFLVSGGYIESHVTLMCRP